MRKWLVGLAITFVIVAVGAGGGVVLWMRLQQYFHPQWVEHYSIDGDRLHVVDQSGAPVSDALVVRVAVLGATSGGWDIHSVMIPKKGERPWTEIQDGATWDVRSSYTSSAGDAGVPPFAAKCEGHSGLGCSQNDGYFAVIIYKRGYDTKVIVPGVDLPAPQAVTMGRLPHTNDPRYIGYEDWYRLRSVLDLILPQLPTNAERLQDPAYYNHHLPDGKTVLNLARQETNWLKQEQQTAHGQQQASELLTGLESDHPEKIGPMGP